MNAILHHLDEALKQDIPVYTDLIKRTFALIRTKYKITKWIEIEPFPVARRAGRSQSASLREPPSPVR